MSEGLELFPVAIGTYTDERLEDLEVDTEVAEIAAALAAFEVHRIDWDTPAGKRSFDAVNTRLNQWAKSTRPQTILYWVGHGWSNAQDVALAHADSPVAVRSQGVSAKRIADAIVTRAGQPGGDDADRVPWMIVVIDACQSAAFVRELKLEIFRQAPTTEAKYLLIGGLAGAGATDLGRFSTQLRYFLHTARATELTITLRDLAAHFIELHAEVEEKRLTKEVVLRRRYVMPVNLDLDTRNQLMAALDRLDPDELLHFVPKAYGGEMPVAETMIGEQSWYFQGRHNETRQIVEWLEGTDTGMLVVTGPAGSGKSALLGHLVVHANPTLRTALDRADLVQRLPPDEQPPDNIFDAVLHLTGAPTVEVLVRLAALAERRTRNSLVHYVHGLDEAVKLLIDGITSMRRRVTILVDALDEAVEPLLVASRILAVLARTPQIRVVVGTRTSTHESPDRPSPDTDLLDALHDGQTTTTTVPIAADATAVAGYVGQRLRSTRTVLLDRSGVAIDVESLVADVYRRAPQFLFARLLVHELLADPRQRTRTAWTRLLARDHQSLFAAAVARLSDGQPALLALLKALAFARGRGLPAVESIWVTAAQALTADPTTTVSNIDVDRLTKVAAAYVLADHEHGQTVYRLAHRTFTAYFTNDTEPTTTTTDHRHHLAITDALVTIATEHIEQVLTGTNTLNPYLIHYLPAHAAAAGQPGWNHLDAHTTLLLALDPGAVATNAWRSSSGRYPLPATVAAITTLNTHLEPLAPRDRYLPIQVQARHLVMPAIAAQLPPWAPPITVETTMHSPSSRHRILTGHTGSVSVLTTAVTADGRTLLASAGDDGSVRLWDPFTGRQHGQTLTGHTGWRQVWASVVTVDGRTLLAAASLDDTVRLWDPVTGRQYGQTLTGFTGEVLALALVVTADGRILLAYASWENTVRLWDPVTGRQHGQPLAGHTGWVLVLASVVTADGRTLLASAGDDKSVRLWDPVTGRQHGRPLTGHTGSVSVLASVAAADGRVLLASASDDHTVRLWDPVTGRQYGQPLTGHTGPVRALTSVLAPDGRTLLASGGSDNTVRLWDLTTNESTIDTARPKALTSKIDSSNPGLMSVTALASVAIPDGRTLLASAENDKSVRLWDPVTGRQHGQPLTGAVRALTSVVAPDGRPLLAYASDDYTVWLWDPVTGRRHGQLPKRRWWRSSPQTGYDPFNEYVLASVVTADGRTLVAAANKDRSVWLWDLATGRRHGQSLRGHRFAVLALMSVVVSDGRTLLASASLDDTVRLWDPVTGRQYGQPLIGHTGPVRALTSVLAADGRTLLASASDDHTIRLWDPVTGRQYGQPLIGHAGAVRALTSVVASDGRTLLASLGSDNTVRLWELSNGEPILWQILSPVPVPIQAIHGIGHRLAVATLSAIIVLRVHCPPPR
ncbi:hypothetical protein [Nocardia sp.]|uniref:nSTAND1 domain-containing NTPase n=1 Tax=Nocardia sp. TaxID=1821 RepID=UPI0025911C1F|nr:hypothetical protein [Nocardia sp.]